MPNKLAMDEYVAGLPGLSDLLSLSSMTGSTIVTGHLSKHIEVQCRMRQFKIKTMLIYF